MYLFLYYILSALFVSQTSFICFNAFLLHVKRWGRHSECVLGSTFRLLVDQYQIT